MTKKLYAVAAAALLTALPNMALSDTPGFMEIGPGADDLARTCANSDNPNLDHVIATCTQVINSIAWKGVAWPYLMRAITYNRMGKYDSALADLDQAINLAESKDPNLSLAYKTRCLIRVMVSSHVEGALSDCNKSLELKPADLAVVNMRGFVEYRLGKYAAAIDDFNRVLTGDPKSAPPLYLRGLAKFEIGDLSGGQADMAAAEAYDPKISHLFVSMGVNKSRNTPKPSETLR